MRKNFTSKYSFTLLMRISTVVFFALVSCGIVLAGDSRAQQIEKIKITVNFQHTGLEEALLKVKELSGLGLIYNSSLNLDKKVNLKAADISVAEVLTQLLHGTGFMFRQEGQNVVFIKKTVEKNSKQAGGEITGRIYDSENQEGLIGANVVIEGTSKGVSTDIEGVFRFTNIPAGEYNLIVSFIGYQSKKLENIRVIEGKETQINIALNTSAENLGEVVVQAAIDVRHAPIVHSTERSLVETIRETPSIVTGISNQQIVRSLDRDAGQIVRRVPGVSLIDRFVLIRGLNPRYNVIQINGLLAPSSEVDQRAFSFDLLPTGVIDQIMVYKSPSAELPGGFAGGVVKIKTKSTNIARRFRIGFSSQYQPGSAFTDHQTYGNGSSQDWLASGFKDRQWENKSLYDMNYKFPAFNQYPGENVEVAKSLNYSAVRNKYHNLDKRMELEYYDSWKLGSMRLNNLTSAFYTNARDFNKVDYQFRPIYLASAEGEPQFSEAELMFTDSVFNYVTRISGLQNLNLIVNENHQFSFDNLFNRSGRDQVINREGFDADQGQEEKYFQLRYKASEYYQGQLRGDHRFGKLRGEWKAGYTRVSEKAPDVERYYFTKNSRNEHWITGVSTSSGDDYNRVFTEDTRETGYAGAIDLEYDLTNRLKFKAGGLSQQTDRSFSLMGYTFMQTTATEPGLVSVQHPAPWTVIDSIFSADRFRTDGSGYVVTQFNPTAFAAYKFKDRITAAYASVQYKLFNNKITINTGVRYEKNIRDFLNFDGTPKPGITLANPNAPGGSETRPEPGIDNVFWLPSANISYNLTDAHVLRLGYGKTIDRPDYREQTYFRYYNYETQSVLSGNPYLEIATIHNYDLRWEFYPREGEFVAAGVFYKRFNDAIETYDATIGGFVAPLMSYENTRQADVYGIEAEFRRSLGFASSVLKQFSVIANVAFTKSNVTFHDRTWDGKKVEIGLRNSDRPMVGTSPYVINTGIYYDGQKSGTKVSALYNVIGPRLRQAAGTRNPDQYELERHVIDLVVTQQITKILSVKAGVQDILNQKVRFYRDENLSGNYNPGTPKPRVQNGSPIGQPVTDYIERSFRPGSYYSLGFLFTF